MYKVSIEPHWRIAFGKNPAMDTALLLRLLTVIHAEGAILQAAKIIGLSYRHAWGLLREAEEIFGAPLLQKHRGRGATLTRLGTTLLWADRRINARLSPTLESLSSELERELARSISDSATPVRLYASYGFAVAALMERINAIELPVELRYLNSMESLAALSQKECELAGFHVPSGAFETETVQLFMQYLCPKQHQLIHLAHLKQGLLVAPGNPKKIRGLRDIAKPEVRFVNRQTGSGTRRTLELLLKEHHIPHHAINGFETSEFTHAAVAAYIASDMADAGFGVETAARHFGLDFVPLTKERYFFAVCKNAWKEAPLGDVLNIIQSEDFKRHVNQLGGYDANDAGQVLSFSEAFGAASTA
ncbi:MAG: helix-turn-helix transcriptional regulator [Burkholderiaceae bacterium]|jgi:molybdate transport repressor ModE-like protein|nr:helix-turn-helix transcriptional regulator [Burkholderiaceae bacterium]